MPEALRIELRRRPSTLGNMTRALYPSAGLAKAGGFPSIVVSWRQHRVDRRHLDTFLGLTGLEAGGHLPLLFPHVVSFPLQMTILTHPMFPAPIWGALQVRNHLLQHRRITTGEVLEIETRVAGQRFLEKGAEVDLHSTVRSGADVAWESLNTFYYRGRFGPPGEASTPARSPEEVGEVYARWRMPSGTGRRFGELTGDYNGIHLWSWYARLFGFKGAFLHPQLSLGLCMARLAGREDREGQCLDAWLKGPVYYGSAVTLRAVVSESDRVFALLADEDERPRIVGRWSLAKAK
ncbi:MAG: acyl dehydratase [Candidatus Rokubacteria bacterium]|nr:acyl dehydratase [Candidatus Rokubacteria bacterium]